MFGHKMKEIRNQSFKTPLLYVITNLIVIYYKISNVGFMYFTH